MRNSYRAWLACTLFWLLFGLMYAFQINEMLRQSGQIAHWQALNLGIAGNLFWVPVTMGFWALAARFPPDGVRKFHLALRLIAALAITVFLRAVFVYLFNPILHWYEVLPDFSTVLKASVQNNLLMVAMLIGSVHGLVYFEREKRAQLRLSELQAKLTKAQLDALSARLNPHFLFNAMNSIAELVHQDANAADRMILSLSELLRKSLAAQPSQTVALSEELELLKHYLAIEHIRLAERLQLRWLIDADCLPAQVPVMILQPLVENAIVHAISKRRAPGLVCISAARLGANLRICISDSGASDADNSASTQPDRQRAAINSGLGLSNTRARLSELYGAEYRLEITTANAASLANQTSQTPLLIGLHVEIEIPWQSPQTPAQIAP